MTPAEEEIGSSGHARSEKKEQCVRLPICFCIRSINNCIPSTPLSKRSPSHPANSADRQKGKTKIFQQGPLFAKECGQKRHLAAGVKFCPER